MSALTSIPVEHTQHLDEPVPGCFHGNSVSICYRLIGSGCIREVYIELCMKNDLNFKNMC